MIMCKQTLILQTGNVCELESNVTDLQRVANAHVSGVVL